MKKIFVLLSLLSTLVCTPLLTAQEFGSLSGVVADDTGAVIADADVKLTDTKTNANYGGKTNSVGSYTFVKLLPGPGYKLTVTKEGFDSIVVSTIYIGVGSTTTQNIQLQIGKVTATVEVSGVSQPVTLDTTDATVGNNFDMHMIHELPIQGRDSPAALLSLQPGVVTAHAGTDDPSSSREGAVTGARADQSNITLDGLDVNDFATGQAFATSGNAPVDSIQEFRGETANPLASSGRGSGAQIQLVTQSGSNTWHGGLYEYHRNTITEANDVFNARAGVAAPKLIRNQFGAKVGGPVVKDKLFFFFNYYGRRDASEDSISSTVPLDSFRAGNIGYINDSSGCTFQSRQNSTPACISFKTPADTLAMDPANVGNNTGLLSFINSRYPHANDLTGGDGVNTGGFRFNAPLHRSENDYVGRVDYNLSENMKLFGRVSIVRDAGGDDSNGATVQFPGDPVSHEIIDHSYAYVIGHTWTISPSKVNNFFYGETRSDLNFPTTFNPVGANIFNFNLGIVNPYSDQSSQHRTVPVPVFRDDFTWVKGKHNFQMGGTFKPISATTTLVADFNTVSVGLGGLLNELDPSLRPLDLLPGSSTARTDWDAAFPFMLGRFGDVFTRFENGHDLTPLPAGTGHTRKYRYYETEAYFQDTWRVRDDLTMTYGLRYQFYSVPYETGGLEAVPNLGPADFYNPRVAVGLSGTLDYPDLFGPLVSYNFGGKANHAPGLYQPDWKNFAPRLAFSYNPGAEKGLLSKLLGNRKSVIRAGAGIVFDHTTASALNFIQDQNTYIFQGSNTNIFTDTEDPAATRLQNDPRFSDINTIPTPPTEDPITVPFTPAIDGTANTGLSNYAIDPKLKTPYSIQYSFGIQRELPGNFLFEATYFGRLGRRLLGQADAGQYVDYQDQFSPGHSLAGDFFAVTKELRSGVDPSTVTSQPFFEDLFGTGATQFFAENLQTVMERGDLTDFVTNSGLAGGLPGVGLSPQFGSNVYVTNKGFSSYNALLATLHKRSSHGLQFDLNYTFSHSIDNVSVPANNAVAVFPVISGNLICDFVNLRSCRGNSDFDVTHIISGDFIYDLPFGRGKSIGGNMPGWANQMFGGWQISGIPSWRSGFAFTTVSGAFPISFYNNSPAILVGSQSDIKTKIHDDPATGIQVFADQTKAIDAFRGPLGLEGGSRNNLRGPSYTNLDLGVAKHFPIHERFIVEFRADAYNVFNHVNFGLPDSGGAGGFADITDASSFGVINTAAAPRQMQFALRLDF